MKRQPDALEHADTPKRTTAEPVHEEAACGQEAVGIVGCMAGTFEITGDVISPEPDIWDAMDDSKSSEPA